MNPPQGFLTRLSSAAPKRKSTIRIVSPEDQTISTSSINPLRPQSDAEEAINSFPQHRITQLSHLSREARSQEFAKMSIPTFNAYLHALLNPQAAGYLPPLTIPSNLSGQASGSSGLRIANPAAPSESGVGEGVGDVEQTGILGLDLRGVETEIPTLYPILHIYLAIIHHCNSPLPAQSLSSPSSASPSSPSSSGDSLAQKFTTINHLLSLFKSQKHLLAAASYDERARYVVLQQALSGAIRRRAEREERAESE